MYIYTYSCITQRVLGVHHQGKELPQSPLAPRETKAAGCLNNGPSITLLYQLRPQLTTGFSFSYGGARPLGLRGFRPVRSLPHFLFAHME